MKIIYYSFLLLFLIACNNMKNQNYQESTKSTQAMKSDNNLLIGISNYIQNIESNFDSISNERKGELTLVANYIDSIANNGDTINLNFICTHNSRRSHMSQIWAQIAAYQYNINNVFCYSGGTEATAFNPRSVKALRKAGIEIMQTDSTDNPVYDVKYANDSEVLKGFSKKYDDEFNPKENFIAVMTCSHADQNCPIVYGATKRFAIPYEDPKIADNTANEEAKYDERCKQIATEMFYLFSKI